jgi:hypothetical protein
MLLFIANRTFRLALGSTRKLVEEAGIGGFWRWKGRGGVSKMNVGLLLDVAGLGGVDDNHKDDDGAEGGLLSDVYSFHCWSFATGRHNLMSYIRPSFSCL